MAIPLKIQVLREPLREEFLKNWDVLYLSDTEAQFFLSRGFIAPILESNDDAYIVAFYLKDVLVGLLPLFEETTWDRSRRLFRTVVRLAGSLDWADYNGMLVHDAHERDVLSTAAAFLKTQKWGQVRFKHLRMSQERRHLFLGAFEGDIYGHRELKRNINNGETNNLLCPAVQLPQTFDDYLAGLSRNTRQVLRRFLRKVDAGELVIRKGTLDDLPVFEKMWAAQWPKKTSVERRARKYASILAKGFEQDTLNLSVLMAPDGPVLGLIASFDDPVQRSIRFFVSARDVEAKSIPVGKVLHAHAIRQAIEAGYLEYDFLRGDEPYKFSLGAFARPISYSVVRRRSSADAKLLLSPTSARSLAEKIPDLIDAENLERAKAAARQLALIWKQ